ncbi:MAG: hypothetical protein HY897_08590 [Deltaproteobacteria bacterium]|nr:hypothetical protein [Deltaproteobacteria bacterium]
MTVKAEYMTDTRGRRTRVVLTVGEYQKLMERLESLEDSLDLKKAKRSARGFVDLDDAIKFHRKGTGR